MRLRDFIDIVEGNFIKEEDEEVTADQERVTAISQLLIDKTDDANIDSTLNTDAFIKILNDMGMAISVETLMDMVADGVLDNIIVDVNQDVVTFKGKGNNDSKAEMSVDKARDVVDTMAKRSLNKSRKK